MVSILYVQTELLLPLEKNSLSEPSFDLNPNMNDVSPFLPSPGSQSSVIHRDLSKSSFASQFLLFYPQE